MVTVGRDSTTIENLSLPRRDMVPRCCENGRPVVTDPHTGQTICSCQYSSGLLAYPRVPTLGDAVYGPSAAYAAAAAAQSYLPLGADGSAFYSPLTSPQYDSAKEAVEGWRHLAHSGGMYFPYDNPMAAYSYGAGFGPMDLNAARRKNATKEATNTLKAWLYEHRKNPYPTKGEKIMLAIITKMTLTQVSTWFANARRRLKKENKMTWSPRNRSDDDGDDFDDLGDDDDKDDDDKRSSTEVTDTQGRTSPSSPSFSGRINSDKPESNNDDTDDHVTVDDLPGSPSPSSSSIKDTVESRVPNLGEPPKISEKELPVSTSPPSFPPSIGDVCSSRFSIDKLSSVSKKSEHPDSGTNCSPRPKIWSVSQFLPTNSESHRSREAVTSTLSLSTSHPYHMTSSSSPAHRGMKTPGQSHSFLPPVPSHTNFPSPLSYVTHPLPITLGSSVLPFPYSLSSAKNTLSSPSTTLSRQEALLSSSSSGLRPSMDALREPVSRPSVSAMDLRNNSPIS